MAVQREIVDKDGNRLTVVQGGAGKAAVYGKTAEGEWVPLQVDAAGRAVLNVGEVSATIGVVEQGAPGQDPWPVQLNGSNVPSKLAPAGLANKGFVRNGSIAANTTETLIEYIGQCELESLVISQNAPHQVKLLIATRQADGSYTTYAIPRLDGMWVLAELSPSLLNDHNGKSDFFELFKYDTANNKYSYGMKRQMKANGGIRVQVWNSDSANPYNASIFGDISTYES